MKHKKNILPIIVIVLILICGCTKEEESVDANYWREKFKISSSEEGIIEKNQTAAQEIIDEGKDAASTLYQMTGDEEENVFFEGLGQSIGKLLKQWGKDGLYERKKADSSSTRAEVSLNETTILEDATNAENGRIKVGLERVVDGDTIMVSYKDWLLRVRLIGINAPESVHMDESKNTAEGEAASEALKELLSQTSCVWLEFDQDPEDDYGRALAYVWLTAEGNILDEDLLNGVILKKGFAEIMTVEPNNKYVGDLEKVKN